MTTTQLGDQLYYIGISTSKDGSMFQGWYAIITPVEWFFLSNDRDLDSCILGRICKKLNYTVYHTVMLNRTSPDVPIAKSGKRLLKLNEDAIALDEFLLRWDNSNGEINGKVCKC